MRLLRTIGGVDVTGQERATLNKLTMPCAKFYADGVGRPSLAPGCSFPDAAARLLRRPGLGTGVSVYDEGRLIGLIPVPIEVELVHDTRCNALMLLPKKE